MPDERSQRTSDFFETISEDSALYVPSLFWFEISNLLASAIKRKRINKPDVFSLLELLPKSKFNTDVAFGMEYANSVTTLATEYDLSSYDAAYLELAIRKDAQVGTLDNNLLKACAGANLQTI